MAKERLKLETTEERIRRISDAIFYGRLSCVERVSMIPECSVAEVTIAPRAECMRAVVEANQLRELKRRTGALSVFATPERDNRLKIVLNLDEPYGYDDEAGKGVGE